ncbi:hypothetical protein GobsT_61630 [Gemmata obscuriglobus]|nr:hypothetical protein GobsT_61630 [Gemmata obscuriglobus]VTS10682.1 unnamed protein product [Gemmata obscuriglobus UQM 2246]
MSSESYLIDTAGFDWASLLSAWAWLLPKIVFPGG